MRTAAAGTVMAVAVLLGCMGAGSREKKGEVSFKNDVHPVIQKYCLPCHAEENYNPSELTLDSYSTLMAGGKHGKPVAPGDPDGSILVQKLSSDPPFGDQMPLKRKRRGEGEAVQRKLTDEEMAKLRDWIAQGARDN